jgi:hypothetical protein
VDITVSHSMGVRWLNDDSAWFSASLGHVYIRP